MGIGIGHNWSCSSYDKPVVAEKVVEKSKKVFVERLPNPDPKNFEIKGWATFGRFLILQVNYPNCTNYEGNKILVYENVSLRKLKLQGSIDPHFSNNPNMISPIARFVPTNHGWDMAVTFCDAMLFHDSSREA